MLNSKLASTALVASSYCRVATLHRLDSTRGNATNNHHVVQAACNVRVLLPLIHVQSLYCTTLSLVVHEYSLGLSCCPVSLTFWLLFLFLFVRLFVLSGRTLQPKHSAPTDIHRI